jgi:AcrR family transcriptional regulator
MRADARLGGVSSARSGATDVPRSGPSDASIGQPGRRRRGPALEDAILDAAHAEFAEHGWEAFTVEAVALRSGAAKSVIYRRWRSRVDLALAVLERANVPAPETSVDSRGIRAELLGFVTGMAAFLRTPFGAAVRGVERDGDVRERVSIFYGDAQVSIVQDIVDRAIADGELDHEPSVLAINLGHSIVMSEFVRLQRPPDDDALAELVDTVWLPALQRTARLATADAPSFGVSQP